MTFTRLHRYGLLTALAILIFDQITKIVILAQVHEQVTVLPFFNFVLVWNRGISFGLFTNSAEAGPLILSALSLLITACLLVWLWRAQKAPLAIAMGAVIGGAVGNVIDRVRFGAVVDFLDFHAFGWHWPAFNVADSAIVLGIAFIVLDGLFFQPDGSSKSVDHNDQIQTP